MATEVGVISDTHGLLRDAAVRGLSGVAMILHAGDVGAPDIIERLSTVAPVHAVRGNIDIAGWAAVLPATRTVEVERARIYIVHNLADLDFDPSIRGVHAVISGHSHKAKTEIRGGVLFLNPGSAGPRRFRLPVTIARITVDSADLRPRIITLTQTGK